MSGKILVDYRVNKVKSKGTRSERHAEIRSQRILQVIEGLWISSDSEIPWNTLSKT